MKPPDWRGDGATRSCVLDHNVAEVAVARDRMENPGGAGGVHWMPLQWRVSRLEHAVLAVAQGPVVLDDIVRYLDALEVMGLARYEKTFVVHSAALDLSRNDLRQLTERLVRLNDAGPLGPVAVVGAPVNSPEFNRLFSALAGVRRPLHWSRTIHDARRWLKSQREQPRGSTAVAIRALSLRQS
ncbi:MAG: hypothetical protein ISP49_02920 [Reyranella sp.]|nr:hypothetical protein [Reyranella sp.]MBL6650516.1 hypothetical protein [Reyranella sp.]